MYSYIGNEGRGSGIYIGNLGAKSTYFCLSGAYLCSIYAEKTYFYAKGFNFSEGGIKRYVYLCRNGLKTVCLVGYKTNCKPEIWNRFTIGEGVPVYIWEGVRWEWRRSIFFRGCIPLHLLPCS